MSLGEFNWLDWLVVAVLILTALDATRRGFLLGALDVLAVALAVVAAIIGERPLGDALAERIPGLSPPLAHLGVFVVLLIGVQIVVGEALGRMVAGVAQAMARGPLGGLDRLLGIAPGLLRGLVMLTFLLLPFALLPIVPVASQAISESSLANRLVSAALALMPAIEAGLGQDFEGGLPSLVVAPPESAASESRPLPVGPVGPLEPDQAAESRMLELVNAERSRAGVAPLMPDDRLREVARSHSLEMFQSNYFSHISPTSGSPFDRLRAAGINFTVAGENLAYAPNVDIAHQGLMNSPGHRANVLRAEFGRVGIGVIRSQAQGEMFTQEFTN